MYVVYTRRKESFSGEKKPTLKIAFLPLKALAIEFSSSLILALRFPSLIV